MNCSYATLLHNSVKIANIILSDKDIEFVFFFVGFDTKNKRYPMILLYYRILGKYFSRYYTFCCLYFYRIIEIYDNDKKQMQKAFHILQIPILSGERIF